ncbi:MAG: RsmB/NOP family class I SAM-dependent RNA methyltransferase, partial [Flavobacteriales bacterium]|nr:RsmB/NOP family class I SAM-dependent RNA methyltransferase [Flavobacteriales bacterium]
MPNLPIAFVDRIHLQFAGDAQTMLAAMHLPPGNSVLINSHKQAPLSFDTFPVPWCPAGGLLHDRPRFALDPLWHAGAYYVQESSSMLLWHVLNSLNVADQHLAVLDACAAPGGKSLLISSWLGERGWLLSNEVNAHRNAVLRENMIKWGRGNTLVSREETHRLGRLTEKFDIILVDAPCSGEGMFRKDEEACALWSPENVSGCARRQQQLLNDLLPALKDGGWLIYSTCTYAPEENEQNAQWLAGNGLEAWRFSVSPAWG